MLREKFMGASKLSLIQLGNVVLEQREMKAQNFSACRGCFPCACGSESWNTNASNFHNALQSWMA